MQEGGSKVPTVYEQLHPVPARRHPLQITLAIWTLIIGLTVLLGGDKPTSINRTLPTPLVYAWAGGITFGSALLLLAALDRDALRALYLELVAHLPLAFLCGTYAGAVIVSAGPRGIPAAGLLTANAIGFGIRAWQVTRTLRHMHRRPGDTDA